MRYCDVIILPFLLHNLCFSLFFFGIILVVLVWWLCCLGVLFFRLSRLQRKVMTLSDYCSSYASVSRLPSTHQHTLTHIFQGI